MVTLAYICESEEPNCDVFHCGEDLTFLSDGRIFVATYFAIETFEDCEPTDWFSIAVHGDVLPLEDSDEVKRCIIDGDPQINENRDIKKDKFIFYNHTFRNPNHPSNRGFEGNFDVDGRKVTIDGYDDIYFPKVSEVNFSVIKKGEINKIDLEYSSFEPGNRYIFRIGFLLGPPKGRNFRLWIYPSEIHQKIHFYSSSGLPVNEVEFLNEQAIADIRLFSPFSEKEIKSCDFFHSIDSDKSISGFGTSETTTRLPYGREGVEYDSEKSTYHKYVDDLHQTVEKTKNITGTDEKVDVLEFDKTEPYELVIKRSPQQLLFALPTLLISLFLLFLSPKALDFSIMAALLFSGVSTLIGVEILKRLSVMEGS